MENSTVYDKYLKEHLLTAHHIIKEFEANNKYEKSDDIPTDIILMTEYAALLHFNLTELGEKVLKNIHEFDLTLYFCLDSIVPNFSIYFDIDTFINAITKRRLDYVSFFKSNIRFPYPAEPSSYEYWENENTAFICFANFSIRRFLGEEYIKLADLPSDRLVYYDKMFAQLNSLNKDFLHWIYTRKKYLMKNNVLLANIFYIPAMVVTIDTVYIFCAIHFVISLPFIIDYFQITNFVGVVLLVCFYTALSGIVTFFFERYFLAKYCLNRIVLKPYIKFLIIINAVVGLIINAIYLSLDPSLAIFGSIGAVVIIAVLIFLYRTDFDSICPPEKRCRKRYIKVILCFIFFITATFCRNFSDYVAGSYSDGSSQYYDISDEREFSLYNNIGRNISYSIKADDKTIRGGILDAGDTRNFELYKGVFRVYIYDNSHTDTRSILICSFPIDLSDPDIKYKELRLSDMI